MPLDYSAIKLKELLHSNLLFELDRYRYLPLHLVILYLMITKDHCSFCFSDLKLTTAVSDRDPGWLGINLIHKSKSYRNRYINHNPITYYKMKHPYEGIIDIFKTPIYPSGVNITKELLDNEKDIIFARNKSMKRLITSLVQIESSSDPDSMIPFYLAIPYLFMNKDKLLLVTDNFDLHPVELQYDPQNVSIRWKECMAGSKYGKNPDQTQYLSWYEDYIHLQKDGRYEERAGDESFRRFRLPEKFYQIGNI